jgi:protocatechuate 3,4-dioxygenase beta subunit
MMKKEPLLLVALLILGLIAVACDTVQTPTAAPATPLVSVTAAPTFEPLQPTVEPADLDRETSGSDIEPIDVTYFTPSQQEGPYYTVEKPADRDSDLVDFAGAAAAPAGQVLFLNGVVYDASGLPVEGVVIEIWQTDDSGVYLHPNDPGTGRRDPNFQFYGEATTGGDGVYSFRTILPGVYEPRPRHIHVKVKRDGVELLTTQFYFGDEVSFSGDEVHLLVDLAPAEDDEGKPIWVGARDIILNIER